MKIASCEGQLVKWKDDRGFGFIKPNGDKKEIFLHQYFGQFQNLVSPILYRASILVFI